MWKNSPSNEGEFLLRSWNSAWEAERVSGLQSQQPVEEGPVLFERDAQVFCRGLLAAVPLSLE
jgi:hypothetical protein